MNITKALKISPRMLGSIFLLIRDFFEILQIVVRETLKVVRNSRIANR